MRLDRRMTQSQPSCINCQVSKELDPSNRHEIIGLNRLPTQILLFVFTKQSVHYRYY